MNFYKSHGKPCLDMTGDLVLHKKAKPVTFATKSALPFQIHGGHCARVTKGGRIRATITALNFIWTK